MAFVVVNFAIVVYLNVQTLLITFAIVLKDFDLNYARTTNPKRNQMRNPKELVEMMGLNEESMPKFAEQLLEMVVAVVAVVLLIQMLIFS